MSYDETFLMKLLSTPTAPFREYAVIEVLTHYFKENHIPHFQDSTGNIVVGVNSEKNYKALLAKPSNLTETGRLPVFIAHMDHPGFHGVEWLSHDTLKVRWLGGTPTQFCDRAPVWIADRSHHAQPAILVESTIHPSGRFLESGVIKLETAFDKNRPLAIDVFGGFRFRKPVFKEGSLYYTKAADDLGGCFAIAMLAKTFFSQKQKKSQTPFIGLLTRAEEVGYIGAIAHFSHGYLQKAKAKLTCVSLETSRALPGAEIGKGPVVRLGDKFNVFDANALQALTTLATYALPEKHQRRIMDGGTCEGTVAMTNGISTIGISVPLGNYHNQSFEGGPDSPGPMGPAPEFIHEGDLAGMITLCAAIVSPKSIIKTTGKTKLNFKELWKTPYAQKAKECRKSAQKFKKELAYR